ncbi:MAG: hypothetical protein EXR70_13105 [Deltaproteobacteria bacterium]|nr:hypothetical protein [Deltaproteobacteria bacterium]
MISQRGLNLFGFLTLILVFVNMFLLVGNQSLQQSVAQRQQVIMQSLQMQGPAREIIGAMANLAVRTDDAEIKKVLAKYGITVTVTQQNPAEAAVKGK